MLKYEVIFWGGTVFKIKCSYRHGMMHGKYIANHPHVSYMQNYYYDHKIRITKKKTVGM